MHEKKNILMNQCILFKDLRLCPSLCPSGLVTILKKGGHNYSSIINNWSSLVGKKLQIFVTQNPLKQIKN